MQAKLEARANFKKVKLDLDVVELLKLIKSVVYSANDKSYTYLSVHETKRALLNFFQSKHMTNVDFKEKLLSLADMVDASGGGVSNNLTLLNLELNILRAGTTMETAT